MDASPSGKDDRRFEWNFELDETDYKALARASLRKQRPRAGPFARLVNVIAWAALSFVFLMLFRNSSIDVLPYMVGFIVGAAAVLAFMWFYHQKFYVNSLARLNGTGGKTFTILIDDGGIRSRIDTASMSFAWTDIELVDETNLHYFVWPNSVYALILPKRVFGDADEARRFAVALKVWRHDK